tara:strand:+ start:3203 stop:4000 length:798 start_codon:yes stop_codon:yes gene_type:complete
MSITATNASLTTDVIPPFSIDDSTLANDQYLVYNSTTEKFENKALSVGGAVAITGATNLGSGSGVFESASTHNLQFKSIIGGAGITMSSDATSVTITNDAVGVSVVEAGNNLGAGTGVFGSISGDPATMNFKSLVAGSNITITNDTNTITIANTNVIEVHTFKVNFDGAGNVSTTADLPAGWSTSIAGNVITVNHTIARNLKNVSYLGHDAGTTAFQLRYPTSGFQATVPDTGSSTLSTTQFKINVNSSVTGADLSGHCIVNAVF